jgi:hypothetical protein
MQNRRVASRGRQVKLASGESEESKGKENDRAARRIRSIPFHEA